MWYRKNRSRCFMEKRKINFTRRRCTKMLHEDAARRRCTKTLHEDVLLRLSLSTLHLRLPSESSYRPASQFVQTPKNKGGQIFNPVNTCTKQKSIYKNNIFQFQISVCKNASYQHLIWCFCKVRQQKYRIRADRSIMYYIYIGELL